MTAAAAAARTAAITLFAAIWLLALTGCSLHPKRGGYYQDDGPSAEPPANLADIPEAVPRAEPLSRSGNRPYTVNGRTYYPLATAEGYRERGIASWYGQKFHGRMTSSREPYDMCSFSAAHKTLPLPSFVRVTNLDNGRSAVVRVNDRGPFHEGRIIDLSYAAAIKLGLDRSGTARVEVEALAGPPALAAAPAARPIAAGSGRQVIQVGSYSELDNAYAARDRLRAAGIDGVQLAPVEVGGRTLWRVRIGPLAADVALALVEQVRGLGFSGPRVFSE